MWSSPRFIHNVPRFIQNVPLSCPHFKIVLLGFDYKNQAMHLIGMLRQGQAVAPRPLLYQGVRDSRPYVVHWRSGVVDQVD